MKPERGSSSFTHGGFIHRHLYLQGKTANSMRRVRVTDEWFSVEEPDFGTKHHAKTLEEAESIAAELDAMSYEGATKAVIIPKKSYHYENIPA